jgi:acyl-CoA synthetase (NDP forming)
VASEGGATEAAVARPFDLARLIRPRSIAIAGIAPEPGSPGFAALGNIERFGYGGEILLVSRSRREVAGRACIPSLDDLPEGVDVAMLMLPRAAIEEAVAACARRGVGGAIVFAAGFGEAGGEWAAAQDRIAATARAGGLALCGPNCLGIVNYIDGVPLTFSHQQVPTPQGSGPAIAVVAQSGGLATILRNALQARDLPISYTVSTGNEAVLGLEDYIEYLLDDARTRVFTAFAEEIRRPQRFLAVASRARALGKAIVLLHPGRSERARASAQSHTGALAGDHAVMTTIAAHHGIVMVAGMDELIDATELLARFPKPPTAGLAVLTDSGAFKGMTLDFCAEAGIDVPDLPPETAARLRAELPEFVAPSNPLDITAQAILHLDLYTRTITPLLEDPTFGSLLLGVIITGSSDNAITKARAILAPLLKASKPVILGLLGDEVEIPREVIAEARGAGIAFFRSPERGLRALSRITAHGRALARTRQAAPPAAANRLAPGLMPEHHSKTELAAWGIPIPKGRLARDIAAAQTAAASIGFPVALKLQSRDLPHKSDIGGVALGIATARQLETAWRKLERVARAQVHGGIDGILVEAMAKPGLEMIIGARRDPGWGPVVLVGLGGIWAEALDDVRLLPPDLAESEIDAEMRLLKGARIFDGMRGMPARDVAAAARIAARIGTLMLARPEISEIDLNPVVVHASGDGAVAVDALIVAG